MIAIGVRFITLHNSNTVLLSVFIILHIKFLQLTYCSLQVCRLNTVSLFPPSTIPCNFSHFQFYAVLSSFLSDYFFLRL